MSVKWYCTVIFSFIFLFLSEVKHFFICLLAIHVSFLVNFLFTLSSHFSTWLLILFSYCFQRFIFFRISGHYCLRIVCFKNVFFKLGTVIQSVILAPWEAEIGRIMLWVQSWQKVFETSSQPMGGYGMSHTCHLSTTEKPKHEDHGPYWHGHKVRPCWKNN
jgi:hypothetical protein